MKSFLVAIMALLAGARGPGHSVSWCDGDIDRTRGAWRALPEARTFTVRVERTPSALAMLRDRSVRPISPRRAEALAGSRVPAEGDRFYLVRAAVHATPGASPRERLQHLITAYRAIEWNSGTNQVMVHVAQLLNGPYEAFNAPLIVGTSRPVASAVAACHLAA